MFVRVSRITPFHKVYRSSSNSNILTAIFIDCQAFFGKNCCANSLGLTLLMICFIQKNPCLQIRMRFKHISGKHRKAFLILKINGGKYYHLQEHNFANK